jgi:hypothetical protein
VAILAASALVWTSSQAAFSSQTRNSGNDWSTGSVQLTDDDAGTARFQVTDMTPGQTETKCIKVTARTDNAGTVKGYVLNPVTSAVHLEDYIKIEMRAGSGGGFANCAGFVEEKVIFPSTPLSTLASSNTYESGVGGWDVPADTTATRTYKITWTFDTGALTQAQIDQLQGSRAGIDIQWELRTT